MKPIILLVAVAGLTGGAAAQTGGAFDLSWSTIDGGGAVSTGGTFAVMGTIGQADAGTAAGGARSVAGGFWACLVAETCYANCDSSSIAPVLNVADFSCFLNRFAAGDPWANCDGSTSAPTLNVQDFSCFLNQFAAGCS